MSKLPEGWAVVPAGELGEWRGGGTPSKSNDAFWRGGTIPWVSPKDMKRQYISDAEDHITEVAIAGSATNRVPENSILMVTRSGILQHSLPVAINTVPVTVNQDLKALSPFEGILPAYILRHLQADAQRILESASKTGTTVESIDLDRLKAYPIRLAPLPEQKRIVAKVDGLTSRTARARADLDRIPTLIARYKQRLLALAFSGELTAGWRAEAGLPEPKPVAIDSLSEGLRYGTAQKCYEEPKGTPVLRIPNLSSGRVSLDDLKYTELESTDLAKLILREGDILIVRSNGSADLVGRPALVTGKAVGLAYAGYLIRIRPNQDLVVPKYLTFMLEAPSIRKIIEDGARSTSGVHNVNAKELGALRIPIFHLDEQAEIVRLIDSAFNWLDRMAIDQAAATNFLPTLNAAILAKAFRGELVPQDPNDEPASMLLERIRLERAAAPKQVRLRKPRALAPQKTPILPHNDIFEIAPRTPGASAMTKSRQDGDVMGKPYLANLLKASRDTTAQHLFKVADLPVADFYKQLAWEIANKHIRDDDKKLEAL